MHCKCGSTDIASEYHHERGHFEGWARCNECGRKVEAICEDPCELIDRLEEEIGDEQD